MISETMNDGDCFFPSEKSVSDPNASRANNVAAPAMYLLATKVEITPQNNHPLITLVINFPDSRIMKSFWLNLRIF
jgi:hypothetical protein